MKRLLIIAISSVVICYASAQVEKLDDKMSRSDKLDKELVHKDLKKARLDRCGEGKSRAEIRAKRMREELSLSDAQYEEVLKLFSEEDKKRVEMKGSGENKPTREQMIKHREYMDGELKKILSADQYKLLKENRAKHAQARKEHHQRE